ncbi:NAD-dependent epimerase/dehydratase family protein [Candidatus Gracilibacteria bacterium]|nr:NAD-dependent epimerase/dehydratase family protein [Candidatus Gracilibacteria bacterium]
MHTLIIGGTGLISTAITRQLIERGDRVTLYNRGQTPPRFEGEVTLIQGDRRNYPVFEAQIQAAGPFDCVIEMIGFTGEDSASLLRAVRDRTAQIIFCSTVDVYARPADSYPYYEDAPRRPASHYGVNKVISEDILLAAHTRGEANVTILRPAHTYGEGGNLIHSFGWTTAYIDRLRKGKPIVVHGDGMSLWVSCHVDDVARAFVNAIGNQRASGRCYHVTGEEWNTWNRYHEIVARAVDAPPPQLIHIPTDLLIEVAPEQAGICGNNFQFSNVFDNSAARADLDFRYTIPFEEGARRTVAWLDANGRIVNSDDVPLDDRIIAAWQQLSAQMIQTLR